MMVRVTRFIITLGLLGHLACFPPEDEDTHGIGKCRAACDTAKDCGPGLICGSAGCMPDECLGCFQSNRFCSFQYDNNDEDVCEYAGCN